MWQRVTALCAELWRIAQEGTFSGTFRYLRFKRFPNNSTFVPPPRRETGIGVIGAGTYVASIHLPCLRALKEPLVAIVSHSGKTASALAHIYDMSAVHNTIEDLLNDDKCDAVLVATPHHLHPEHIIAASRTDRYVYCEKPVAIDSAGVKQLEDAVFSRHRINGVMVGFNRRFAPAVVQLRQERWLIEREAPLEMYCRVNFGPRVDNAMSDPSVGGGRIHGAACHYVDLFSYIARSPIASVNALAVCTEGRIDENTFVAIMQMTDGSVASLTFTSEGSREHEPKEEVLLSCEGHVARIVDYARLSIDGRRNTFLRHRYGAMHAMQAFVEAKRQRTAVPVPLVDGIVATRVTLAIEVSLRNGAKTVYLDDDEVIQQHKQSLIK